MVLALIVPTTVRRSTKSQTGRSLLAVKRCKCSLVCASACSVWTRPNVDMRRPTGRRQKTVVGEGSGGAGVRAA